MGLKEYSKLHHVALLPFLRLLNKLKLVNRDELGIVLDKSFFRGLVR